MATGQDGPAGASVMAAAEGYGGRSEALTRQIAQKIASSRRRGLSRLKMNLNPAELGRLDIDLTVKDGALTAKLRASNREAYRALAGQIADLKRALADSGVSVAGLSLSHEDETLDLAELAVRARAEARQDRAGELLFSQVI
jgi:flagellar hook-length control protein FliK